MRGTATARTATALAAVAAALAIGAAPAQSHQTPVDTGSEVVRSQAVVTLTGVLQRGVEGGCFTLRASGAEYVLRGEISEFLLGRRVVVTGEWNADAGPCMQGRTLLVHSVVPAL
ncbi:DUF5818 domain-containing protein [Glycomyces sp. A-F 0318]|uniref:DUF5818 domain-containing protein n=1 Tax=Glycomyces amatae TaxID=2881355 RepID=UPI001E52153A|nr:DUF5818 domain-containing protein [Glycomyces amatae]MCD0445738.1 DUF5818 domain-containing protein [Glycomyces amatae]